MKIIIYKAGGNFGHAGRPGQVGGSAPRKQSIEASRVAGIATTRARIADEHAQASRLHAAAAEAAVKAGDKEMEEHHRKKQRYHEQMHIALSQHERNRVSRSESVQAAQDNRARSMDDDDIDVKRFDMSAGLDAKAVVGFREVKAGGEVVDVLDVRIKGYLTTWKETTPADREGEYVVKGAFSNTIHKFMENPVMLRDHKNLTDNVAGSFTKLAEDDVGLYFEASLSNAENMKSVRRNVVDGHLQTVSMGGAFRYEQGGKGIREVALWEGTLTPVPTNPDARFTLHEVSPRGKAFLAEGGTLAGLKSIELEEMDLKGTPHPHAGRPGKVGGSAPGQGGSPQPMAMLQALKKDGKLRLESDNKDGSKNRCVIKKTDEGWVSDHYYQEANEEGFTHSEGFHLGGSSMTPQAAIAAALHQFGRVSRIVSSAPKA